MAEDTVDCFQHHYQDTNLLSGILDGGVGVGGLHGGEADLDGAEADGGASGASGLLRNNRIFGHQRKDPLQEQSKSYMP